MNSVGTHPRIWFSVCRKFLEHVLLASQVRVAAHVEAATMLGVVSTLKKKK